jgi:hypothetical protein
MAEVLVTVEVPNVGSVVASCARLRGVGESEGVGAQANFALAEGAPWRKGFRRRKTLTTR